MPLGFPRALLRIILLVFGFQRRVGLWCSVSQPVTTYAAIIAGSVFSCAILHMLFTWPCDCLMSKWPRLRLTKYVDDLTISYRGMNHTVATVITEAVSSMVGWLEKGLDFHVSKDEKGVSQSRSDIVDEQGRAHAEWSAWREVHGHAADETEGFSGPRLEDACRENMRDVLSPGGWRRTSATRRTRAESSPLWHGQRQFGTSSWTMPICTRPGGRQQRRVGLKLSWSKVSGPTGAIIMCLRQLGWTWPHNTTFVTASGHEVDLHETSHELVCSAHGAMPISLPSTTAYLAGRAVGTVAGHHLVGTRSNVRV